MYLYILGGNSFHLFTPLICSCKDLGIVYSDISKIHIHTAFPQNMALASAKLQMEKDGCGIRLCHNEGHADPPPQKCPHQKVIVNGAQCSESNGKNNKKILRFLFFELSSKIGVIFS